jgi:hypothetical protein
MDGVDKEQGGEEDGEQTIGDGDKSLGEREGDILRSAEKGCCD